MGQIPTQIKKKCQEILIYRSEKSTVRVIVRFDLVLLLITAKRTREKQEGKAGGLLQECGEVCRWSSGGWSEGQFQSHVTVLCVSAQDISGERERERGHDKHHLSEK